MKFSDLTQFIHTLENFYHWREAMFKNVEGRRGRKTVYVANEWVPDQFCPVITF
jgi:hypothetical protein